MWNPNLAHEETQTSPHCKPGQLQMHPAEPHPSIVNSPRFSIGPHFWQTRQSN